MKVRLYQVKRVYSHTVVIQERDLSSMVLKGCFSVAKRASEGIERSSKDRTPDTGDNENPRATEQNRAQDQYVIDRIVRIIKENGETKYFVIVH